MTSLRKVFVLAVALVLALTVGGGAGFAQDGEIVGIEVSYLSRSQPYTLGVDRAVGSAEGVTVDLAADTVRLGPGKYWISTAGGIFYDGSGNTAYGRTFFSVRIFPSARFLPFQGKIAPEQPSKSSEGLLRILFPRNFWLW